MRWLKFNAVGAVGMAVQLGSLAFFVHVLGLHYLLATALAVEAAVLHNFFWHRKWTWGDRRGVAPGAALLRFNLTTGLVSLGGNILSTYILTGFGGLDLVVANLLSIVLCSLANLFLSDRLVFAPSRPPAASEGTAWEPRHILICRGPLPQGIRTALPASHGGGRCPGVIPRSASDEGSAHRSSALAALRADPSRSLS